MLAVGCGFEVASFVVSGVCADDHRVDIFASQQLVSHHFDMRGDRAQKSSGLFRYALPGEFDLMARIAGLALRQRWAGWGREPFTNESTSHVSVWQKR